VLRVWRPVVGRGAVVVAGVLFGGLWIAQISGAEVMPNLWVALGSVAVVGWFLRVPGERRARWWLVVALAGVTLVRLPDGGWLVLPLLVVSVVWRVWRPALPALVVGVGLGAVQWVWEAYARFGGIAGRLRVSSATEGGMAPYWNLGNALRSLNGPQLCRPCQVSFTHPELTLWWLALPLLATAALLVAIRDRRRRPVAATAVPLACAVSVAVPYLLLINYSAPRSLLPCYALLSLPLGRLAVRALHAAPSRRRALPAAALATLLALQLGSQLVVLNRAVAQAATTGHHYVAAARGLRSLGLRPPCLVAGPRALPVAYHAGCASAETSGNNRSTTPKALLSRAAREPTAILTAGVRQPPPGYARSWVRHPLPGIHWVAYLPPGQARTAEPGPGPRGSGRPGR
jgi:hypothetical protein